MSAVTGVGAVVVRELLATRASVGLARSVASGSLRAWGLGRYEERALAIVSELVTNAVAVSAPADTVRLYINAVPERLVIGVSDAAVGRAPRAREAVSTVEEIDQAASEEFGGWGLMLVAAFADAVWTEPAKDGTAKWVCASIGLKAAQ
ncbi:ATP-binding protein [Spirillospora sp. CA-255316]